MAQTSGGKLGGIIGGLIALVFFAGLVATPFYLHTLQADDRAAERAAADGVEEVRRNILALDASLAALGDLGRTAGAGDEASSAPLPADLKASLDQTTRMLQAAESNDRQRGTQIVGNLSISTGAPQPRSAAGEMKSKYAAQHEKLLAEADQKLRALGAPADNLGAARIKAIVEYARGRLLRNRAEFERWQAALARRDARSLDPAISELRITIDALEAQIPSAAIEAVEAAMSDAQKGLDSIESLLSQRSAHAAELREQIADQEQLAAEARKKMAALATAREGALSVEYAQLASTARAAEARVLALTNGTLEDAVETQSPTAEIVPPQYQGGSAVHGLRDLEIVLADLSATRDAFEAAKKDLQARLAAFNESAAALDDQKSQASARLSELTAAAGKLLAEAAARDEAAATAETAALKAFAEAGRSAKQAANSAKTRTNDARSASAALGGATPDPRLERISADNDPEGSMHFLAGEAAYYSALIHATRIAAAHRAVLAGADKPPIQIGEARTAALKFTGEALDAFKKSSDAISKTKVGTISGRNYLWQVQVAQAAATLLRANLAEDAQAAHDDRAAAHKLLTEAAKGREQSPLLTPAIDTLVYLQEASL